MSTSTPDEGHEQYHNDNPPVDADGLPVGTIELVHIHVEPMRCTSMNIDGVEDEVHLLMTLGGPAEIEGMEHVMKVPFLVHNESLRTLAKVIQDAADAVDRLRTELGS